MSDGCEPVFRDLMHCFAGHGFKTAVLMWSACISTQEALWRVEAFADAGADIVFIDALETREEMRSFCNSTRNTPKV